jgi:hypothetical protein
VERLIGPSRINRSACVLWSKWWCRVDGDKCVVGESHGRPRVLILRQLADERQL